MFHQESKTETNLLTFFQYTKFFLRKCVFLFVLAKNTAVCSHNWNIFVIFAK